MTSRYEVRGAHVPYEPHCRMVYQWQVLKRRSRWDYWMLVASYPTEAEAKAAADALNEAATSEPTP